MHPKWDGIRVCAEHHPTRGPRVFSRHGQSLTARLPTIAAAISKLPAGTALDGELIALTAGPDGHATQDFAAALTVAVRTPDPELARRLHLAVFDLPRLAGQDLCATPQTERLERLDQLDLPHPLCVTSQLPVTAGAVDALIADGWEGVVLKRARAYYRPGERSSVWRKLKARRQARAELVAVLGSNGRGERRVLVDDDLGRWPALVWPGPIATELEQLGSAAVGRTVRLAYSRRDANGAPRDGYVSLLRAD